MIGSVKVFIKDLYELVSRPFLGAWLVLVPLVFLYVAGNIDVHPSHFRTLVQPAENAKPVRRISEARECRRRPKRGARGAVSRRAP